MATKSKKGTEKTFLKNRLGQINKVLVRFEGEVERAVSRFVKKGEKSGAVIRKNLDEIAEKLGATEIYSKANEKTEELVRDVRRVADDVVSKMKNFDVRFANPVLKDIRSNIDDLMEKLQNADLIEKAKDKVVGTRKHLFTVLSIPSQEDVRNLSEKVVRLEKKVKALSLKAAA